jgi:ceramide glucosyltransferase
LAHHAPPVSLLKPLHGAEPRLADNLATFLAQDYAGPVQLVCGVNRADDAALEPARALAKAHPQADIALHPGPRLPYANAKVGNLAAMLPLAFADILILSDSDIAVSSEYLAVVLGALDQPGVGAVSCLYVGRGDAGLWSRIGAAAISWWAMPNMVVGITTGAARPCMGSTIALRRETLEAIGGFAALSDVLADDYAIGESVARLGLEVAVPPLLVTHADAERSWGELWRHHLRWAVTIRALAPWGHAGSLITHALPLALLAALLHPWGIGALAFALVGRIAMARAVNRLAGRPCAPLWLLPLADLLNFLTFIAAQTARTIDWRGASLTMRGQGRIAPRYKAD